MRRADCDIFLDLYKFTVTGVKEREKRREKEKVIGDPRYRDMGVILHLLFLLYTYLRVVNYAVLLTGIPRHHCILHSLYTLCSLL